MYKNKNLDAQNLLERNYFWAAMMVNEGDADALLLIIPDNILGWKPMLN
jgi:hypothetical protein